MGMSPQELASNLLTPLPTVQRFTNHPASRMVPNPKLLASLIHEQIVLANISCDNGENGVEE
jgi:hypothetical protein